MIKEFASKIASSGAFAIFFIIWVPLVACGGQGLVDAANGWVAFHNGTQWFAASFSSLSHSDLANSGLSVGSTLPHGWITTNTLQVWMRCMQTSWAFLGFMLMTTVIQWALSASFGKKIGQEINKVTHFNHKEEKA